MIIPLVQYPHCAACSAMNAACTLCGLSSVPRPSSVVTARPSTCFTEIEQDRTALPSSNTVQAAHCPRPEPNFTACSARELRKMYRSGCAGSHESTVTARPFTRNVYFGIRVLRRRFISNWDILEYIRECTEPSWKEDCENAEPASVCSQR